MNIGIDIRPLMQKHRTGVGEYTYELLNALFNIDQKNQYFLFYNSYGNVSNLIPKWNHENARCVMTDFPNKIFNAFVHFFNYPKLDHLVLRDRKARKRRDSAPFFNADNSNLLDVWFSPNINFTALSKNVKRILTIHDLSFEYFPECYSLKRRLWHQVLNPRKQCARADVILTPSENTRWDVIETYFLPENKVKTLKPWLAEEMADFRLERAVMEAVTRKYSLPERFVLFLGAIEPRKNIIGLIDAFKEARELGGFEDFKLVLAGAKGWKCAPIMKAADETDDVMYIGYVEAKDKFVLYSLADLFVYPSLYEGFGFPVLEAMAASTPVITSNRSSLPEITDSAAYLVNPYDISEMARGIRLLLKDDSLRKTLVERGKERVREHSWRKAAEEFLLLLEPNKFPRGLSQGDLF